MTLDELDVHLREPDVGSVTLSVTANGKAYATVYFRQSDGSFKPVNHWGASNAEALQAIFSEPREKKAEPTALSGLLV